MKKLITAIAIIAGLSLNAYANVSSGKANPNAKPQTTTKNTVSTADKPTQASVIKLMQVMQMEKNLAQMQDAIKPQLTKMIEQSIAQSLAQNDKALNARQRIQLTVLVQNYIQEMLDTTFTPEYHQKVLAIATKVTQDTYTQAEVDAMIAFYDSPIGQSIITKQNTYAAKLMSEITPLVMSSININQSKERKAKLFGELERIMSSK